MILLLCCLLLAGCGRKTQEAVLFSATETQETDSSDETTVQKGVLCAYICGSVKKPGVYELPDGSRICDLVDLAGGMTKDAKEGAVNLAEPVTDGQMVNIPANGETDENGSTDSAQPDTDDGKVDLNTASADQLMTLSGIGEAKAGQIIQYREQNGRFQKIEDLMNVPGIKQGTFDKLKDRIKV